MSTQWQTPTKYQPQRTLQPLMIPKRNVPDTNGFTKRSDSF